MIGIAGHPNELHRPAAAADVVRAEDGELQRACVAVLRADWSRLAIVGTFGGVPFDAVTRALVELSRAYRLGPVRVLSGSAPSAAEVPALLDELATAGAGPGRMVVAVGDPSTSPASVPLILAVDATVLLVRLGATELRVLAELVELAGPGRTLGCVVVS